MNKTLERITIATIAAGLTYTACAYHLSSWPFDKEGTPIYATQTTHAHPGVPIQPITLSSQSQSIPSSPPVTQSTSWYKPEETGTLTLTHQQDQNTIRLRLNADLECVIHPSLSHLSLYASGLTERLKTLFSTAKSEEKQVPKAYKRDSPSF